MSTEIKTPNLEEIAANYKKVVAKLKRRIIICGGTGCIANGSMKVRDAICAELEKAGEHIEVVLDRHDCSKNEGVTYFSKSGCQGFCQMGPILRIEPEGIFYCHVKPEDAAEIVHVTLIGGEIIDRLVYVDPVSGKACRHEDEIAFYSRQTRVVLANYMIEPDDVEEYIAREGYVGARKAITEMTPEQVCQTMIDAGLRGRGGGGFPCGQKWASCRRQKEFPKYIVCNGDEGDPGAFMDRSIMEGDPNRMIEGMMIAGIAIGAAEGYIYVRAEYPLAVERLRMAIKQAEDLGLLGDHILGTNVSFRIHINRGAGAFVCGEGSALTQSIEGKRGMPRVKPPRTVEHGLFEKPTNLNNVETYANVPMIIEKGAKWYRTLGVPSSPGTKAFALTGTIRNTGLIEVPMGTTLREVIFDIGGGMRGDAKFKAVQIGGPSGGCLTEKDLDMPLDFDSLTKAGAMIGSGGMVVMDDKTCMVEVARFFMNFTQNESCGKCVPCREGTYRMLEILERIVAGQGEDGDIELLEELADTVSHTALCGLGKTAPNPVLSTIKNFRSEYEAHIYEKRCPAGQCSKLRRYVIDPDLCRGCSKCARNCPASAITGELKHPYVINQDLCIKCGVCQSNCNFDAVREEA